MVKIVNHLGALINKTLRERERERCQQVLRKLVSDSREYH